MEAAIVDILLLILLQFSARVTLISIHSIIVCTSSYRLFFIVINSMRELETLPIYQSTTPSSAHLLDELL